MPRPPARRAVPHRFDHRPIGSLHLTDHVPYIASWSAETTTQPEVVMRRGRLAYRDERPWDRDSTGILWRRMPSRPGRGRPQYGKVHLLRQRRAMEALLCQVCGLPAASDATDDGVLWLLNEDPHDPGAWLPGLVTGHPPVCLHCAWLSVRACPHLRRQYAAVRVRRHTLSGVHGLLHIPGHPHPLPHGVGGLDFGDTRMPWMQAAQLMMRLDDLHQVDLESEYLTHTKQL
ncbi:hypothetical protein LO772_02530 [Yinghuangia sp. ASG 101]|uniref:hypothetical protein n=1 Tax=Yinghuangia sp. ASG 101 TaxID=2896848 RepID=UPI001E2A2983|nr:hypothetical protein [Yinghuangia sp. ASG 101]UGQ12512.1 hypothetical protein LO772_02530 [Yinghuangia sp. ASG 101]